MKQYGANIALAGLLFLREAVQLLAKVFWGHALWPRMDIANAAMLCLIAMAAGSRAPVSMQNGRETVLSRLLGSAALFFIPLCAGEGAWSIARAARCLAVFAGTDALLWLCCRTDGRRARVANALGLCLVAQVFSGILL